MSDDMKKFSFYDEINGIKLVSRPSDLDPYDDEPRVLRAVLSCGHVTSADTLTNCCKAQMDKGQTYFQCPLCKQKWSYGEVRKLAKLIPSEQRYFEETLGKNTANKLANIRNCPGCGAYSERTEFPNICVECKFCTAREGKVYEFCWQCGREWKGPRPRSDQCDNENCNQTKQDILRNCNLLTLIEVENVQCPSIRACPNCQVLIQHTGEGCKIMTCNNCQNDFCFICLKSAEVCLPKINENGSHNFKICRGGVAPTQCL